MGLLDRISLRGVMGHLSDVDPLFLEGDDPQAEEVPVAPGPEDGIFSSFSLRKAFANLSLRQIMLSHGADPALLGGDDPQAPDF